MPNEQTSRRSRGTGSVYQKNGTYYGQWWVNGRRVKRSLGPVRKPRTDEGLTQTMAEARLRKLMGEVAEPPVPITERYTLEEVGSRHIAQLRKIGRRPNTLESYESYLRVHIGPWFQSQAISRISADDVEAFIDELLEAGQSPKSVRNYLGFLHGVFDFALRKRWVAHNPCKLVEKPRDPDRDEEIHFLDPTELDALVRAVPGDELGRMEAVLYRTAAMTGLRQGELLALRWSDIDWPARKVRVRRSLSRGVPGPTKSKRSSRAVPLADTLGGELDRWYQHTPFKADEDLVFAHPLTGGSYDRSRLLKRFKAALKRAKVREVRFHDLRHTFGTMCAAAGIPMRMIQEWMGHRDIKTTQIYADYAPAADEPDLVDRAFAPGGQTGGQTAHNSMQLDPPKPQ